MQVEKTDIVQLVSAQVEANWEEEVKFLQEIGRFPSESGNEKALQSYLAHYLSTEMEMEVNRFPPDVKDIAAHPGFSPVEWSYAESENVIATAKGADPAAGYSLIFQGHVDVVSPEPVSMWSYDPFSAVREGGKIYARGILDMKAGLAAMIFAYKTIQDLGYRPGADFMIQCVVDEERTGNGALAALEAGYTAEAALIPEPFGQKVSTAQLGSIWFRITLETAEEVNVIEKLPVLINALKQYEDDVNERERPDAFKEQSRPIEVCIGSIDAGDFPSNVPKKAVMEGRAGLFPGQNPAVVKDEIKEWITQAAMKEEWMTHHLPEVTFFGFHAEGAAIENDQTAFFQLLDETHEKVTNSPAQRQALNVTTDARFFNLYYDIPAVCYGPTGGNIHGVDEWADLESMKEVTKVYAAFLAEWCGLIKKE
ncbi:ArgE/DapE family deacylase [Salibacterium aidingense]|uniref:ArgE/DapE family deacylase n=1 Tax=Salibacterium aidingense TaxID=384933 RepID=UPI003BE3DD2F